MAISHSHLSAFDLLAGQVLSHTAVRLVSMPADALVCSASWCV